MSKEDTVTYTTNFVDTLGLLARILLAVVYLPLRVLSAGLGYIAQVFSLLHETSDELLDDVTRVTHGWTNPRVWREFAENLKRLDRLEREAKQERTMREHYEDLYKQLEAARPRVDSTTSAGNPGANHENNEVIQAK